MPAAHFKHVKTGVTRTGKVVECWLEQSTGKEVQNYHDWVWKGASLEGPKHGWADVHQLVKHKNKRCYICQRRYASVKSPFYFSWHSILVNISCLKSVSVTTCVRCQNNRMIYLSINFFHNICVTRVPSLFQLMRFMRRRSYVRACIGFRNLNKQHVESLLIA